MRRFADAIGPGEDEEPFVVCLENGNHALDGAPGIEFRVARRSSRQRRRDAMTRGKNGVRRARIIIIL